VWQRASPPIGEADAQLQLARICAVAISLGVKRHVDRKSASNDNFKAIFWQKCGLFA
jgi:hypothetical protein